MNAKDDLSWEFIGYDEGGYHNHKIVKESDSELSIRPTYFEFIFRFLLMLVGFGAIYFSISKWEDPALEEFGKWFLLIFGTVIGILGGFYYLLKYLFSKKKRFIKNKNGYFQGNERTCKLTEITSIQLVSKIHGWNNFSKQFGQKEINYSYQINLILENRSRLNIITHGDSKEIQNEASLLSEFLDVPILDGINYQT